MKVLKAAIKKLLHIFGWSLTLANQSVTHNSRLNIDRFKGVLDGVSDLFEREDCDHRLMARKIFDQFDFGGAEIQSEKIIRSSDRIDYFLIRFRFPSINLEWDSYMLVPKQPSSEEQTRVMVCFHGQRGDYEVFTGLADGNDYGGGLAKKYCENGFIVLVPRLPVDPIEQNTISAICFNLGFSYFEYCIAVGRACLSYCEDRYGKQSFMGVWGGSIGAAIAVILGSIDLRISVVHTSAFYRSMRTDIFPGRFFNPGSEAFFYISKGFWSQFEFEDFFKLICPRRLVIEIGEKDRLLGASTKRSIKTLMNKYIEAGVVSNLSIIQGDFGHEVDPELRGFHAVCSHWLSHRSTMASP